MKERMITITCPHCGHVFQIKRDTLSIARMNSVIDDRLNDGTHFTHVCQHCMNPFYMMYPFLYRDPEKKYCLILSNQKEFSNLPKDEKIIVCKNVPQFLLAYKICSQQLNFNLVLKKKKILEGKYSESVKFESYDELNHCLWFLIKKEKVALLLKDYEVNEIYDKISKR